MNPKELAEVEYRNRKPGDPIEGIPLRWYQTDPSDGCEKIFWINPWNGKPEAICTFWWPAHPWEATDAMDALFERIFNLFAKAQENHK